MLFEHVLPGAPFLLFLCLGLAAVGAVYGLRPWPPTGPRMAMVAIWVLGWLGAGWAVMGARWVAINPERQAVDAIEGRPGLRQAQHWRFDQIRAVSVRRQSDGRFELSMQTPDGFLRLDDFASVERAEARAADVAGLGGWPATRRDYRMDVLAQGGTAQAMESAAGRTILAVDLAPVRQVVPAPGQESRLD